MNMKCTPVLFSILIIFLISDNLEFKLIYAGLLRFNGTAT